MSLEGIKVVYFARSRVQDATEDVPLLDLHVRHVAIRASTFAIVIVTGRASNNARMLCRIIGILRRAWRQSEWKKFAGFPARPILIPRKPKHATPNELCRRRWKIWFHTPRIIKQPLLLRLCTFVFERFFFCLCSSCNVVNASLAAGQILFKPTKTNCKCDAFVKAANVKILLYVILSYPV